MTSDHTLSFRMAPTPCPHPELYKNPRLLPPAAAAPAQAEWREWVFSQISLLTKIFDQISSQSHCSSSSGMLLDGARALSISASPFLSIRPCSGSNLYKIRWTGSVLNVSLIFWNIPGSNSMGFQHYQPSSSYARRFWLHLLFVRISNNQLSGPPQSV